LIAGAASTVWPVVIAVSVTVVVALLATAALSLARTAAELRDLASELSDHASAVLGSVEETVERARSELDRVDDLVGSAEAISQTVGSASRLAQAAVSAPLIKIMAFGAGTARAGRRLRGRDEPPRRGRLRRVG
jgi:malonyl CoA-acyl carrier protein transacylase